jgi:hypothetical protein
MHGKERKGNTYYACSYRISYGDKAAEALGHGKRQYVREDTLVEIIDHFFATNVFGPNRIVEAGVDPNLVRDRIAVLKTERTKGEAQLAALATENHENGSIDFRDACEILKAPPDFGSALAAADPQTRRRVFDAFRLSVTLDRNAGQIHVKALISSAFTKARDLKQLVANGEIAGAGFEPATSGL